MTNPRGLIPSKKHVQKREKEQEYLQEMVKFLERRGDRLWDDELRDEYNRILIKHGVLTLESLPRDLRPKE